MSQFGLEKLRHLGTYDLEEDAARAFDKVARILGCSDLNLPNSDTLEINGPRSEGADKAVAAAVEAAQKFMAAGGFAHASIYIGVNPDKGNKINPWYSHIKVSTKYIGGIESVCAHTYTYTHTHAHMHTQIKNKDYYLGGYAVETDAAAARDMVANILGRPLNFEKPREITGTRTVGADKKVADAIKAANALVLGIFVKCNRPDPTIETSSNATLKRIPPPSRISRGRGCGQTRASEL